MPAAAQEHEQTTGTGQSITESQKAVQLIKKAVVKNLSLTPRSKLSNILKDSSLSSPGKKQRAREQQKSSSKQSSKPKPILNPNPPKPQKQPKILNLSTQRLTPIIQFLKDFQKNSDNTEPAEFTKNSLIKFLNHEKEIGISSSSSSDLNSSSLNCSQQILDTTESFVRIKLTCPISGYKLKDQVMVRYSAKNGQENGQKNQNFQPLSAKGLLELQKEKMKVKSKNTRHQATIVDQMNKKKFSFPEICPLTKISGKCLWQPFLNKIFEEAENCHEYVDIRLAPKDNDGNESNTENDLTFKFLNSNEVLQSVHEDMNNTIIDLDSSKYANAFVSAVKEVGVRRIKSEIE